ncbi:MAG: hypothetical protein S4CHLAM102_00170 [Chlamydiia bacterium]|nr:hypothetical protein [Chlamydiia bacterium]
MDDQLVILRNQSEDGSPLTATFNPTKGMNLMSYTKGSIEAIDQNTREPFEKRRAGLGALIGPHFHHRKNSRIPTIPHPEEIPWAQEILDSGQKECFSHGLGRYAPWDFEASENAIKATLTSSSKLAGMRLKELEGFDFSMQVAAKLEKDGLYFSLHVEGTLPTVIGQHYYYAIQDQSCTIKALTENQYDDKNTLHPIPNEWKSTDNPSSLHLNIEPTTSLDYGFHPITNPAHILMKTGSHTLEVSYWPENDQNVFQIYRPANATYVCIEPMTTYFPRNVVQTQSSINTRISIID